MNGGWLSQAIPGVYNSFTPASTGFSSTTTDTGSYIQIGKTVIVRYDVSGTSNATTLTFTLPVTAKATQWFSMSRMRNNGTLENAGAGFTTASSTTVDLRRSGTGTAWTNSGTKGVDGLTFTYEAV